MANKKDRPPTALKWLGKRGRRRAEAVDHTHVMLGLGPGKGHLDNLYAVAYEHGLRDAYAFIERQAHQWRDGQHAWDVGLQAQRAEEDRRQEEESARHAQACEGR